VPREDRGKKGLKGQDNFAKSRKNRSGKGRWAHSNLETGTTRGKGILPGRG